jgi:hypothetical protein
VGAKAGKEQPGVLRGAWQKGREDLLTPGQFLLSTLNHSDGQQGVHSSTIFSAGEGREPARKADFLARQIR